MGAAMTASRRLCRPRDRVLRRHRAERPWCRCGASDNFSNIRDGVESIRSQTCYENYEIVVVANSKLFAAHGARLISNNTASSTITSPTVFRTNATAAPGARRATLSSFSMTMCKSFPPIGSTVCSNISRCRVSASSDRSSFTRTGHSTRRHGDGRRRLVGTAFHAYPGGTTAYFNMAQSVREVSLICGACLAMPMRVFDEVGGFDGRNTPVAHSDVDLCFRVRELGYSCVYTPHAELAHIGHVSIGAAKAETKNRRRPSSETRPIYFCSSAGANIRAGPVFPGQNARSRLHRFAGEFCP